MRAAIYILIAALAVACASPTPADRVSRAFDALELGDSTRAQADIDAIMADSAAFNALRVNELCTLALVYERLSATTENEANDASAARCLARARSLDADSITAFLYSLPGEDAGRLMVLDRVSSYMEMPRDSLVSAEDLETAPNDSLSGNE